MDARHKSQVTSNSAGTAAGAGKAEIHRYGNTDVIIIPEGILNVSKPLDVMTASLFFLTEFHHNIQAKFDWKWQDIFSDNPSH